MAEEKNLFEEDMGDRIAKITGLCLSNYVEIQVLKHYLEEKGIAVDEDRLTDIRREIRLGGAGLREHGYDEWADQVRFTQERVDEIDEVSDGHE
ncbi:MAG TPA: hypothetical protein PL105_03215 [Caldilineaceae bacterium]|nr:hypothetical protein [Caldilineaceae bacterium]